MPVSRSLGLSIELDREWKKRVLKFHPLLPIQMTPKIMMGDSVRNSETMQSYFPACGLEGNGNRHRISDI